MKTLLPLLLAAAFAAPLPVQDNATPFGRAILLAEKALDDGQLELAREQIRRAQERDPRSVQAWSLRSRWAEATGDRDELVYALHREYQLTVAQGLKKKERAAFQARLAEVDPIASDLLSLKDVFVDKLVPVAEKYEKDGRPHSAIRIHKEILALDPERAESQLAIERIASAPDPSLAGDAKPKDLLADVDEEWIRQHDEEHSTWDARAKIERENYTTYTNAGYEVLVRCAEAMEQMNAFYRVFFQYGTEEHGGSVPRIDLNVFATRDEYLELGIGPPVEWSGGHFTGGAVETYIQNGFEGTTGVLFHEAAHQFVSLATNAVGWLNEGLASFFEGCRILQNGTVLMNLPANHRLFPLVERMERGWMTSASDGIDPANPSDSSPEKAPTFRIVLENDYQWGPPWYAPTWGVVYFLYNYEDPVDGRFIYRDAFREFIDKSGGRSGEGAVENFEEVVLGNPKKPTKGIEYSEVSPPALPETVEELDAVWKEWLVALKKEVGGEVIVERPYLLWANYAIERGDYDDAVEHFEKGIVEDPDNVDLLTGFAEHLADRYKNKDRATKLILRALRLIEAEEPVDQLRIDELERKLTKLDPKQKTLAKVHEDLARSATGLVQRYLGEGLNLQAMDLAWRMGNDFDVPGMFEFFEEAARRSKKSLAMWKLAYNEENLDGWDALGNDTFTPQGDVLVGKFEAEEEFLTRTLVLDEITSGDFSMEVEISAEHGRIRFCGLVFGRKTDTDYHAAIMYPPGFDEDGNRKQGFVDLTTFHGSSFDIWRHSPIPEERDKNVSASENWRKLRVDVTGRFVDVWFDDEFVTTQEFGSLSVLRGSFGLIMGPGEARFRNVRYLSRQARDPGSLIERELRMEDIAGSGGSRGFSWLDVVPPFPRVSKWVQDERADWSDRGPVPQLLVLWGMRQNAQIDINEWLNHLAEAHEEFGLEIVCIANTWDEEGIRGYLEDNPFPGAVGVDRLNRDTDAGHTFTDYFVNRFNLPRLILLDIDGKVAWEGDPGLKIGVPWQQGEETYLDAPLKDLLEKRKIRELTAWRQKWKAAAVDALHRGDVGAAVDLLRESREYDWKTDATVLEAQTCLNRLESAIAAAEETVAAFAAEERDPALEVLVGWAEQLGTPVDPKSKPIKASAKSGPTRAWNRALALLKPQLKRLDDGKEPGDLTKIFEKLDALDGPFPRELAADLRTADGDASALEAVIREAHLRPGRWLAAEHFGW